MTIWAVQLAYGKNDEKYYQILPYNLRGTIECHFKYYQGILSLIPFLYRCRFKEKSAKKLANRLMKKLK